MALSKIKNASTDGSVAGGKVLQVVHAGDFAEQSFTLSTTPLATNMTATITPTDVTSKILITYTIATAGNSTGASQGCMHMPYHDIGQTGSFTNSTSDWGNGSTDANDVQPDLKDIFSKTKEKNVLNFIKRKP